MFQHNNFPELLKTYRKIMGLTQEELAKLWNYSSDAISAWERSIRTPSKRELPRIAQLLNIEVDDLVRSISMYNSGSNASKGDARADAEIAKVLKSALETWGEIQDIFPSRTAFNSEISYPRLFENAREILAVGISLNAITINYSTEAILRAVFERETAITLCFLDPDSANCAEREREEGIPSGQLASLTSLNKKYMQNIRNRISHDCPDCIKKFQILTYDLPPRYNIFIIDDSLMTLQTYTHVRGEDTPTFVLKRQSDNGLFQFYASTAKYILEQSKPDSG